ncbi:MAG: S9 family peptidase [Alphaproteobacteria bacterium]
MTEPQSAPYGSWESPITAGMIVGSTVGLGQVVCDGGDIYWTESRPAEGGRNVVCRRAGAGGAADVTPAGYNVRTRVHEYGGGAYTVCDGVVYFCNDSDQRLMIQPPGAAPRALSPDGPWRYADMRVDTGRRRVLAVRETHAEGASEPVNDIVAIGLDGTVTVLVAGADFYAAPRLSPDGKQLAWLSWDHPDMPWDSCRLWLADIRETGLPGEPVLVAGGAREAAFQPEWSPDGILHFVSDRTGWWNLYRRDGAEAHPLCPVNAEFGLPQWVFGMTTYGFDAGGNIIATYCEGGFWRLGRLAGGTLSPVTTPYCGFGSLKTDGGSAVFIAGHPSQPPALVALDLDTGRSDVLRRSADAEIDPDYVSRAEAVAFPTTGAREAHAYFYSPANRDFAGPAGALPPLIVKSHGGPTAQTGAAFDMKIQFWTSRGFAVLDVNYGGSTGYGRAYRRSLDGHWGVIDVDDCEAGARYLAAQGRVDGEKLIITGGSAGGYTTLCALTFRDTFRAGASHYGIGDLAALATDTHKFESRYLDRLVGPWPEAQALYRERSPIHFSDCLDCPVIFFQGLDDKVVPPNQAEAMVASLRQKGTPVAYIPFAGEGHGFRKADNIRRALEGELYFYGRIFGFTPAGDTAPVEIENL